MNSIPQAVKSQANLPGKIALSVGSAGGPTNAFTVKQLQNTVKTTSNATLTPGASTGSSTAFVKLNHAATTTVAGLGMNPTVNTAAKIQIQPSVASSGGGGQPMFSMTVNTPLLNSVVATTTGVKRKADQMENHTS